MSNAIQAAIFEESESAYQEASTLHDTGELDGVVEKCEGPLQATCMPRYHRIKFLALLGSAVCIDNYGKADDIIMQGEVLWEAVLDEFKANFNIETTSRRLQETRSLIKAARRPQQEMSKLSRG